MLCFLFTLFLADFQAMDQMSLQRCLLIAEIIIMWSPLSLAQKCPTKCSCAGANVTCSDGGMAYIPLGIPINTTYLNFRNNSLNVIKNQTQLHNLPKLQRLLLNENNIRTIESGSFWGHESLRHLDLSFNDLRILDKTTFRGLRGLQSLLLHNNPKLCLEFGSLGVFPDLQKLVLGKTAVTFIPGVFETSPGDLTPPLGLLQLELWKTGLEEVPYKAIKELTDLSFLDLSQNQIKCLSHSAFANNKNLTRLDLSSNPIVIVESDTFVGLDKLSLLLLDNTNTLATLSKGTFDPLPASARVCLYGNPWNCDCHIKWLKVWMETEGRIFCAQKPNCHSPSYLQGNPFFSVPREEFRCNGSISQLPTVDCHRRVHYTEGYCSELLPPIPTSQSLASTESVTMRALTTPKSDPPDSNNLTAIVTGICILLVLAAILGGFSARQLRIQKKLHDQNKYFNISYENCDQQLQMAESPTPEREKSFN